MRHTLMPRGTITLWLLYSDSKEGTVLEGVYTHKTQAEADLRSMALADVSNGTRCFYRIREIDTQPHGVNHANQII